MNNEAWKALGDPTRRKIVQMLGDRELSAGELAAEFDISGPSMSHHFSVLKNAGLIVGRREGQQILYRLDTTVAQELVARILDLFPQLAPANPEDVNE